MDYLVYNIESDFVIRVINHTKQYSALIMNKLPCETRYKEVLDMTLEIRNHSIFTSLTKKCPHRQSNDFEHVLYYRIPNGLNCPSMSWLGIPSYRTILKSYFNVY